MLLMGLVFLSALVLAIGLWRWYQSGWIVKKYYDGTFRLVCTLELPLESWEDKFREGKNEEEWFEFQRGYQRGLLDALDFFQCGVSPHIHGNRLIERPAPNREEQA